MRVPVIVADSHGARIGTRGSRYGAQVDDAAVPAPAPTGLPLTGIVIPVREAETIVRQRVMQVTPELLPRDQSLSAHITLLAPFLPIAEIDDGVISELERCFADVLPFSFTLTEVCEFPGGVTYLAPDPASTFRRITQELHRAFPEFPPYGGAFDEVVPHLTVPLAPGEDTDALRIAVHRLLPLTSHAIEAALVHVEPHETHVIATLPFGISAA